mmetsp:Transcript_74691/g.121376  ORF Transcript_74691/g.121376 Transcript_74691/m.121376 type:complete len:115 (-) Transcript_74691:310-654(-)
MWCVCVRVYYYSWVTVRVNVCVEERRSNLSIFYFFRATSSLFFRATSFHVSSCTLDLCYCDSFQVSCSNLFIFHFLHLPLVSCVTIHCSYVSSCTLFDKPRPPRPLPRPEIVTK